MSDARDAVLPAGRGIDVLDRPDAGHASHAGDGLTRREGVQEPEVGELPAPVADHDGAWLDVTVGQPGLVQLVCGSRCVCHDGEDLPAVEGPCRRFQGPDGRCSMA
jgi:hypothetical protein